MHDRRGDYEMTDDTTRMDATRIHGWLSEQAYWALGRSLETVHESLRCATVYGVFHGEQQVAVARVVTDGVTFGYLCDVFVAESCRNQGIGSWLLQGVLAELRAKKIKQVLLATRDAHGFYLRAGFHLVDHPERWLELDPTAAATT